MGIGETLHSDLRRPPRHWHLADGPLKADVGKGRTRLTRKNTGKIDKEGRGCPQPRVKPTIVEGVKNSITLVYRNFLDQLSPEGPGRACAHRSAEGGGIHGGPSTGDPRTVQRS